MELHGAAEGPLTGRATEGVGQLEVMLPSFLNVETALALLNVAMGSDDPTAAVMTIVVKYLQQCAEAAGTQEVSALALQCQHFITTFAANVRARVSAIEEDVKEIRESYPKVRELQIVVRKFTERVRNVIVLVESDLAAMQSYADQRRWDKMTWKTNAIADRMAELDRERAQLSGEVQPVVAKLSQAGVQLEVRASALDGTTRHVMKGLKVLACGVGLPCGLGVLCKVLPGLVTLAESRGWSSGAKLAAQLAALELSVPVACLAVTAVGAWLLVRWARSNSDLCKKEAQGVCRMANHIADIDKKLTELVDGLTVFSTLPHFAQMCAKKASELDSLPAEDAEMELESIVADVAKRVAELQKAAGSIEQQVADMQLWPEGLPAALLLMMEDDSGRMMLDGAALGTLALNWQGPPDAPGGGGASSLASPPEAPGSG